MAYYCLRGSSGVDTTNLQLFSLERAAADWNELTEVLADYGEESVSELQERLTFVVSSLGLSISQLLGQNTPSPNKEKIDQPRELLDMILKQPPIDRTERRRLTSAFGEFIDYYDAVRHFGRSKDDQKHRILDQLSYDKVKRFCQMTIDIWDAVLLIYRQDPDSDLADFASVSEMVEFEGLVKVVPVHSR
ncbi:MAG TPA: hypothetical protein VFE34_15490 [Dongiaceae bacterium]|jgi:hypothetical protein|nr:hypothetical protein [Dongiaceae bacterium]